MNHFLKRWDKERQPERQETRDVLLLYGWMLHIANE